MSPAFQIGEQCHYCSKWRWPADIIHQPGGVKICQQCEWRHLEALKALSTGVFTGECSECGKSAEQLRSPNGQMAFHYENGRYRVMCVTCHPIYVRKRKDLYADTEFGHSIGLK